MQKSNRTLFFVDGFNVYHAIKHRDKELSLVIPIGGKARELTNFVGSSMQMKEIHLRTSQLPGTVTLQNGVALQRPIQWT